MSLKENLMDKHSRLRLDVQSHLKTAELRIIEMEEIESLYPDSLVVTAGPLRTSYKGLLGRIKAKFS